MPSNTSPYLMYSRVQIKTGETDNFLKQIPMFVKAMEREPAALQSEVFYHEATSCIIFLESFDDVNGLIAHFNNPEIHTLQPEMIPRVNMHMMRFCGAIPEEFNAMLTEMGLPYQVASPYHGTHRLHESQGDQPALSVTLTAKANDFDALAKVFDKLESAAAKQPGVLHHQLFDLGNGNIASHGSYADADTFYKWATSEVPMAAAAELGELLTDVSVEALGAVDNRAEEYLKGWGAKFFRKYDGFSRFNR